MNPERWREIEELYHAALELDEDRRPDFLDQACAGDDALRRELESLLTFDKRAKSFIESPALEVAAGMLAKDHALLETGSWLGPYQVLSPLGAGGMGKVYLAQDTRLGRKVALKVLHGEFTQDADRVRRFEQEARTASALNHPNIITIFGIGRVGGAHYIATEFIEGETLRRQMKRSRVALGQALDIACQIVSAIAAAHEAGIVHRDVKPENIMLRPDGYIKVLDFGIAKLTEAYAAPPDPVVVDSEAETVIALTTETGVVMGTTSYMSPEQARGQKVDARTDLFSLGVVLYEMIAGVAPFAAPTGADVLAAILVREPLPLTNFAGDVPEALDWIIAKTLRKDRAERYQTAKELLGDMRSLKQRLEFEQELKRSMGSGAMGIAHVALADQTSATTDTGAPQSQTIQPHRVIDSLAVLPLVNTLADPGMDYFSDGVTESIISALSELPELHVMAWSTVSRYKNRQVDPREVGRDLGVRAVLAWRAVQLGERFVIKTELVDARDGSHLWGEAYSCDQSDIFDVETKISKEISEKLLLRLTAEERKRLEKRYTDNTEAYHAYLKGRHFWNKRTDEGVRQAIEHFKKAIDDDPSYALAYAGLADCYLILGAIGVTAISPKEAMPRAREAASRALELDETLAEARATLAYCLASYYWDWPAAEREFKRCLELKPGYATAHHWYGFSYLVVMGRLDEAIKEVRRAFELDPLSLPISSNIGLLLYLARQYDQAIDQITKTLEIDQNFVYSHWQRALVYEQAGMYEEAIAGFEKAIPLSGRGTLPVALLGHAYAAFGRRDEALAVLDQLNELSKQRYVSPYRVAAIYAGLGAKEEAFAWLDRAYEERDGWLIWLKLDPVLDPVRRDKRFKNLLRKVGLAGPSPKPARRRASQKAIRSLAILPLVNTCDDPGMDYFSDGVTESIINLLAQLPRLRVAARSSAFRYKGQIADPQEAGRALNVEAVLAGRVRQVGDRLIIGVELIDVINDSQLWGEQYNRPLADIFDVQEEIAREITEKLRLRLTRKDRGRISKRYTENVEAYQAYLKGRYFWNKRTTDALKRGVEYFKQAIDLEPGYASAYAGLSDSYTLLVIREALEPGEGFSMAKAAAAMALKIDDALGEAHASLAHAALHNWEWQDAEEGLKRAIAINQGYASAHHWYSEYLLVTGQIDEAIAEVKRARELDPLSLIINAHLSEVLYFARRYDESIEQAHKTLEMDPNFFIAHMDLGQCFAEKGLYDKSLDELRKAREMIGDSLEWAWATGYVYALAGRAGEARELIEQLEEESTRRIVSPYGIALIHTALGERDEAFEWLEKAYQAHDGEMFNVKVDPKLDPLRSDLRFDELLRRVGLAPTPAEVVSITDRSKPAAIAVLPFAPLDGEQGYEYLEMGIADALITKLSNIKQIAVRPTSAVRKYADSAQDSVSAGKEMEVGTVLEGSLQKVGDRIRVTARLVSVEDGRSLWAEKFDEELTDIFQIEDSISERVAAALTLKLTGEEKKRLAKRYTENVEAYHAYLKGRHFWYKRTEEALRKSIHYFNQATEQDPTYAAAYDGLSDTYALLALRGVIPAQEAFLKAKFAAKKALELDDTLGEAYASLAHVRLHDWDWEGLEDEFKRALRLSPSHAIAYHWYSEYLTAMGRSDESIAVVKRAQELDPISPVIKATLAGAFYFAREYDRAIEQLRQGIEMNPDHFLLHLRLGAAYLQKGLAEEAVEAMREAVTLSGRSVETLAGLAQACATAGMRAEAEEMLDELNRLSQERYVSPYYVAKIYASLGENGQAFAWLEKGYAQRNPDFIELGVEPLLDPLRSDPRFDDLLMRVGLARAATRESLESLAYQTAGGVGQATNRPGLKAIAVLPFKPINKEGRDEYLELGMADALITRLSNLKQVVVRPTSAARKYMELETDPVIAGREMRVEAVLEGNIQRLTDRIRITARLVRVEDGSALWAGTFDERFTDIFAVQDSISEKVASALALKLTGEEKERLSKRYTENTVAYHLYLKGRYYWNKRATDALRKSIDCFYQAIEIDPNYALAYSGLADAYTFLGDVGITAMSPREAFLKGRAAAAKALKIDDALAEAHASLGHLGMHNFQWADAKRELERAIELKPNYATTHQWYAFYLIFTGSADDALREIKHAQWLDPLSQPINADVAELLYYVGRYDQAIEQYRKTLEIDPQYHRAHLNLGRVYEHLGMRKEAFAEFETAQSLSDSPEILASLAHAHATFGDRAEAVRLLEELIALSKRDYVSPYDIAVLHVGLGDHDRAFEWLDKAYDERAGWMIYLTVDPQLYDLRSDARYKTLVGRVGLAE